MFVWPRLAGTMDASMSGSVVLAGDLNYLTCELGVLDDALRGCRASVRHETF